MLSLPLERFLSYNHPYLATLTPPSHNSQTQMQVHQLGTASQSANHHIQERNDPSSSFARPIPRIKNHQSVHGSRASGASAPVRRRISRACDQCNQLRTKCDGQHPCAHCSELGLSCEYRRAKKKRGKASKKDLAQQAAAQAAATGSSQDGDKSDSPTQETSQGMEQESHTMSTSDFSQEKVPEIHGSLQNSLGPHRLENQSPQHRAVDILNTSNDPAGREYPQEDSHLNGKQIEIPNIHDLDGFGAPQRYDRNSLNGGILNNQSYNSGLGSLPGYPDLSYAIQDNSPPAFNDITGLRSGNSPLAYALGGGPSPSWGATLPSPKDHFQSHAQSRYSIVELRYPVLEPLLPYLKNIIPTGLACDLVDVYFASSSSAQMHPMSPYVLGYIFRKQTFLHQTKPRQCRPALLASMLWVAAQTSEAPFLTKSPSARAKTCQKLLELSVGLLKPLIHTAAGDASAGSSPAADGVALGGLGVAMPGSISMDVLSGEAGPFGAAGHLDDVITYVHLATVASASEYKGASLRWWNAAWSLARELKLGRELPLGPSISHDIDDTDNVMTDGTESFRNYPGYVTEEEREERRRIWWLMYIVDRHLALCYNRPLFLLDIECDGLLQPMEESKWQTGDFIHYPSHITDSNSITPFPRDLSVDGTRFRGPHFECTGHSIFGYFLPLMTILGEVVDLHHAKNHPRFGIGFRSAQEWDSQTAEIARHLEAYELSLTNFEQKHLARSNELVPEQGRNGNSEHNGALADDSVTSMLSMYTSGSARMTESQIQTRIVLAYGTHVMHVLHILLAGKWDPINLLDDNDLWISTQGFITATSHAVAAAEAIGQILEFDPGLEFMPFFFGIYLLQGSFLLLLIADKLQSEASPSVVKACETIVRAHEACVVTLNTEYQRNFSRVMRSALAQVRGRVPEDLGERHQRRRELLALYRWSGDGTGLAL